jgi:hypothetical protein
MLSALSSQFGLGTSYQLRFRIELVALAFGDQIGGGETTRLPGHPAGPNRDSPFSPRRSLRSVIQIDTGAANNA